ncbi:TrmB family transcriptional regulator, partial [Candidatus Woesearchaeota archaeon]|nr:TrmB family transcriptional regulator [Candidatus Woesearchaeota archaeon]
VSTAGELSDIANVPRSRSYDVLESLEKKGFIVMKLGKPIKYIAVPPEEVLERVKKKVQEDSSKQITMIESLKNTDVLSELKLLHNQGIELVEPTDLSGVFKGRNNLYNHLELMVKSAEKSITLMTTTSGFIRKSDAFQKAMEKAKERGVKIRIAAPVTKEAQGALRDISKLAEVKSFKDMKGRFLVVDGKEVMFMLLDDEEVHPTYDVGVWVNTPFFATILEKLFDQNWKQTK